MLRLAHRPRLFSLRHLRPVLFAIVLAGIGFPASAFAAETYAFSTFSGASGFGIDDGPGSSARFAYPASVVVDASGNIYVSDYGNASIRQVSPSGIVSTLAGLPGVASFRDGTGSAARFNATYGMCSDRLGGLMVADAGNHSIRWVRSNGAVLTLAGYIGSGFADGAPGVAKFNTPEGVAVDAAGNIFVADTHNHLIRKVDLSGNVSTIAGTVGVSGSADGVGTSAQFNNPARLAIDAGGTLYVSDRDNNTIRKIAPNGTVTTFAGLAGTGGSVDGTGTAARFTTPQDLAFDGSGNLYVADRGNHAIRRISPSGVVTTVAGKLGTRGYIDGAATSTARFFNPTGLAVDSAGNLWVSDAFNSCIRKISATGTVTTVAGRPAIGSADGVRNVAQYFIPRGLASDANGNIYVADSYNQMIRKVAPDGSVTSLAGSARSQGSIDGAGSSARFIYPYGIAVDATGNIYVADSNNHTIRKITSSGVVSTIAGLAGSSGSTDGTMSAARFNLPYGVAVDHAGNVFVADAGNATIRRITPDGVVTTFAGKAGAPGSIDGTGAAASFGLPAGIAIDANDNLYVADYVLSVIRKITPAGAVTTIAGQANSPAEIDGTGASARFYYPEWIAVDPSGNLYVTESVNNVIRRITAAGIVTTIAGYPFPGLVDSTAANAAFNLPAGITTDSFGNVYVADAYNSVIRRGGLVSPPSPGSALKNLSVRANIAAGDRLIVGFALSGSKSALIRGTGPGLAPFVSGVTLAANPKLELYNSTSTLIDSNDDWGGSSTLTTASASVGGFPQSPLDSALLKTVSGSYSAHFLTSGAGLGLVEVYDVAPNDSSARLINVSARYQVGTGSDTLVAGFVISGNGPKTVLIRGSGPTLRTSFGVNDAMADPQIKLFDSKQNVIATNNTWDPRVANVFTLLGAFQLVGGSKDAVLVISLAPGLYSAELSGADGGTGNGLIEVYEVGN